MRKPTMVAIMNFITWGGGYLYLGKAWGFWLVLLGMLSTGLILPDLGFFHPYNIGVIIVSLIISLILAWHGYKIANKEKQSRKR